MSFRNEFQYRRDAQIYDSYILADPNVRNRVKFAQIGTNSVKLGQTRSNWDNLSLVGINSSWFLHYFLVMFFQLCWWLADQLEKDWMDHCHPRAVRSSVCGRLLIYQIFWEVHVAVALPAMVSIHFWEVLFGLSRVRNGSVDLSRERETHQCRLRFTPALAGMRSDPVFFTVRCVL